MQEVGACGDVAGAEHTGAQGQRCVRGSFVTSFLAPLIACIPVALLIEAVVFA